MYVKIVKIVKASENLHSYEVKFITLYTWKCNSWLEQKNTVSNNCIKSERQYVYVLYILQNIVNSVNNYVLKLEVK